MSHFKESPPPPLWPIQHWEEGNLGNSSHSLNISWSLTMHQIPGIKRNNKKLVPEVGRCWQGQNSPKGEFKVDRGEMGGHQEFLPHSPTILSNTAPFCHFLVLHLALFVLSLITSWYTVFIEIKSYTIKLTQLKYAILVYTWGCATTTTV